MIPAYLVRVTGFDLHFATQNYCRNQCLHWFQQQSTGLLHCYWFESSTKRKTHRTQMCLVRFWSELLDSNQRPLEPHSSAIPNFAKPGFLLASSDSHSMITHLVRKCKHFFKIFRDYSPISVRTTFPRFQRRTTCSSAAAFCASLLYST